MTGGMINNQARTCGIDEVGRGPLAGPVVAAAAVLPAHHIFEGLRDSKQLSRTRREWWDQVIREQALAFGLGWVWPEEIDRINILQASLKAMRLAWEDLATSRPVAAAAVDQFLIDGIHCPPGLPNPATAIPHGDTLEPAIMAASILAKVARDSWMVEYSRLDERYGFERHKGYPSREHRAALQQHGPCAIHRRSFRGVRR